LITTWRIERMHIREFQQLMRRIYLRKDRERGVERTFVWLVEEVGELGRALLKGDKQAIANEAADVFAWLISLCNLLDIDLEAASLTKYPGVCPRCGRVPCVCREPSGQRDSKQHMSHYD